MDRAVNIGVQIGSGSLMVDQEVETKEVSFEAQTVLVPLPRRFRGSDRRRIWPARTVQEIRQALWAEGGSSILLDPTHISWGAVDILVHQGVFAKDEAPVLDGISVEIHRAEETTAARGVDSTYSDEDPTWPSRKSELVAQIKAEILARHGSPSSFPGPMIDDAGNFVSA